MISIAKLKQLCESMVGSATGLVAAVPVSVEANMADKVNAVSEDETPVLFYLPPSAQGRGHVDRFEEENMVVLFVMVRYRPRTSTSFDALAASQPAAEAVKNRLVELAASPCAEIRPDLSSINILPETEFFGNWAGWSIGFTVTTR